MMQPNLQVLQLCAPLMSHGWGPAFHYRWLLFVQISCCWDSLSIFLTQFPSCSYSLKEYRDGRGDQRKIKQYGRSQIRKQSSKDQKVEKREAEGSVAGNCSILSSLTCSAGSQILAGGALLRGTTEQETNIEVPVARTNPAQSLVKVSPSDVVRNQPCVIGALSRKGTPKDFRVGVETRASTRVGGVQVAD